MLPPLIQRPRRSASRRSRERGVTIALVAVALVSIIAMAGLSIDIGTLYEASAEAQRAADAGALAAARIISMSGVTGDPVNHFLHWQQVCGGPSSPASSAATVVAQQSTVGGIPLPAGGVIVKYGVDSGGPTALDCSTLTVGFGVNALVTVTVLQSNLPAYFSRIWGRTGSSAGATATAEVFNPSNSGTYTSSGDLMPVQPRCVKPWIVPNVDPSNPPNGFVSLADGSILNPGIQQVDGGVIGKEFSIGPACKQGAPSCQGLLNLLTNPPKWIAPPNPPGPPPALILEYVPALVGTSTAVPSCGAANPYQQAIAGCDQTAVYACGTLNGAQADLTETPANPTVVSGDTSTAAQCLINQSAGRDILDPTTFPFQIQVQSGSPLIKAGVIAGDIVTSSNSIVTLPIFDGRNPLGAGPTPQITIVGFLQVFINKVDPNGNLDVTILNVAGCGNGLTTLVGSPALNGTSPVPIRLITPP
jgi:hypothetical protein